MEWFSVLNDDEQMRGGIVRSRRRRIAAWLCLGMVLLCGCATSTIKGLSVVGANGDQLAIESYTSNRDLELSRTKDGWTVKAISSTPTSALLNGLAPVVGAVAKGVSEGMNPVPTVGK